MKQVKIIDQGTGQGKPAFDLLIPTDWQFKSAVNVNVADGGCYGDWFSVLGDAKSADNSVEFQVIPQSAAQVFRVLVRLPAHAAGHASVG
jgi:hypothetical protein